MKKHIVILIISILLPFLAYADPIGDSGGIHGGGGSGASVSVATDPIFDAAGDMVIGTGANTAARVAPGTQYQVWQMGAVLPFWSSTISLSSIDMTSGTFTIPNGTVALNTTAGRIYFNTTSKAFSIADGTSSYYAPTSLAPLLFTTGGTTARTVTLPDAAITSPVEDRLKATFNGGGTTAIVANEKAVLTVPFPCVITGGQILASKKLGTSGTVSAVVDIWKESTPADYDGGSVHPAVGNTIVSGGGTKPTVTTDNYGAISVAGWATTTLAKGDILIFNVDSITDAVVVDVTLYVSRR